MNAQIYDEIYEEAFNDELQKIAKITPEQMKAFKKETKKWQKEVKGVAAKAPLYQKLTPLAGAATGSAAGVATAALLAKRLRKLPGPMGALIGAGLGAGGFLGGAYGGIKAISKTKYGKGIKAADKKYKMAVKKIEGPKRPLQGFAW